MSDERDWCWGAGFRVTHRRALDTASTIGWDVLFCAYCERGEPKAREAEDERPTGHARPYTESHWRRASREAIGTVTAANPTANAAELRELLGAAYPFGPRKHYPYKVWLEEVRAAMDVRR